MVKILTMEAAEAGALSMAAGQTGRLPRPPRETPQHLGVKLGPPGTLQRRLVVQKRREQATSWWWSSRGTQNQNEKEGPNHENKTGERIAGEDWIHQIF